MLMVLCKVFNGLDGRNLASNSYFLEDNKYEYLRYEVFTAVTILMMFFWVWASCGLTGRSQRFGEAYCLHLQG
jgi:hypothetical protein